MKKVLIFPAPFLIKAPTTDQQNDYMYSLLRDEMAMEGIGDFIEVNALNKSDYCVDVRKIIAERKPDWIIAAGESATACIGLHGIKKILVNPICARICPSAHLRFLWRITAAAEKLRIISIRLPECGLVYQCA